MTSREQERLRQKVIECLRDDMTHAFWNPCAVEAQMHRDEAHEAALRVEYFAAHPRIWRTKPNKFEPPRPGDIKEGIVGYNIYGPTFIVTNGEDDKTFPDMASADKFVRKMNLRLMGGIVFG